MEKKTKHRLLGLIIVLGIIIILLPFFQSRKELRSDSSDLRPPPFPDESVQVDTSAVEKPPIPIQGQETSAFNQQPDDTISAVHPSIINDVQSPEVDETQIPLTAKPQTSLDPNENQAPKEKPAIIHEIDTAPSVITDSKEISNLIKEDSLSVSKKPLVMTTKLDLKDNVWVVQIGSFKNKTNALRLVNQLRASGYRAFIQEISTAFGDNTRVFVGPENKQNSARIMAMQLEKDLNIHGVVISYKPLAM